MNLPSQFFRFTLIIALSLGLAACGGDGGDGDNDLMRLTEENARQVASSAVGQIDSVMLVKDWSTMGLKAAAERPAHAEIAQWIMRRTILEQFVAARSVATDCGPTSADGQITGESTRIGNLVDSELRFEQCNIGGSGLVLDGQVTLGGTINNTTGDFDVIFNSVINVSFDLEPTITLRFDAQQSGNVNTGDFTLDFSISVSGPPNTGFRMETTDDLVGNTIINGGQIYDGTIVLYGAGDTRLRLDIIATDFVDIDIDKGTGTFTDYDEVNLDTL